MSHGCINFYEFYTQSEWNKGTMARPCLLVCTCISIKFCIMALQQKLSGKLDSGLL